MTWARTYCFPTDRRWTRGPRTPSRNQPQNHRRACGGQSAQPRTIHRGVLNYSRVGPSDGLFGESPFPDGIRHIPASLDFLRGNWRNVPWRHHAGPLFLREFSRKRVKGDLGIVYDWGVTRMKGTPMTTIKWNPGPLHVNDSAHEYNAADPAFGVAATWIAAIRDENGDVVGNAEGETAEEAIERATYLAESSNHRGATDD